MYFYLCICSDKMTYSQYRFKIKNVIIYSNFLLHYKPCRFKVSILFYWWERSYCDIWPTNHLNIVFTLGVCKREFTSRDYLKRRCICHLFQLSHIHMHANLSDKVTKCSVTPNEMQRIKPLHLPSAVNTSQIRLITIHTEDMVWGKGEFTWTSSHSALSVVWVTLDVWRDSGWRDIG